ncbi:MAG: F0F1 ATP synthase subunit B [Armatimonadetes bacterium]|nr:F0F1 ATP synthase subunit B [Armatimonadota bacterium]
MNENIGPLALNIPLIITQIIGFLLLIWFLWVVIFKRIFAVLDERQKEIRDVYDGLDRDRAAMEETRRQYEERLANIEIEARERIQAAVKEAQALRDNLIADARQNAESITTSARNEAERERQKAFLEMRQQLVALAVAAAGKVVGESLDDARHTRLVDDFITEVGSDRVTGVGRPGLSGGPNGAGHGPNAF